MLSFDRIWFLKYPILVEKVEDFWNIFLVWPGRIYKRLKTPPPFQNTQTNSKKSWLAFAKVLEKWPHKVWGSDIKWSWAWFLWSGTNFLVLYDRFSVELRRVAHVQVQSQGCTFFFESTRVFNLSSIFWSVHADGPTAFLSTWRYFHLKRKQNWQ